MFHFDLRGTEVTCDSVEELLSALAVPGVSPSTDTTRARKVKPKKKKRKYSKRVGKPSESWRLANLYATKKGIGVTEARAYLASHPQAKTRFINSLAAG